jgi:multidrug efflux pump subunit AcrA (membrane-fusion protein)
MDLGDEKLLPGSDQKLLDRPEEERLQEELERERAQRRGREHIYEPPHPPSRHRAKLIVLLILAVLVVILLMGYLPRRNRERAAERQAEEERRALPVVNVVKVRQSPAVSSLLLPGTTSPITEAYIYARASGYVRKRYADIGDRVRSGQLLAEIEAPDLDQQVAQGRASLDQASQALNQARAALDQSRTQLALAKVTWNRYRVLVKDGAVARQDADTQETAYKAAEATVQQAEANVSGAEQNVRGNRANLERLVALQSFEQVRAPFSGTITARNIDVGALISGGGAGLGSSGQSQPLGGTQFTALQATQGPSGSTGSNVTGSPTGSGAQGGEMFRMAQVDVLRILLNVPETDAPSVKVGQRTEVTVQSLLGRKFIGRVTRTANAVDVASRTMLTEVQVPNPDHVLMPGMYVQVKLLAHRDHPPLLVPGDSLLTGPAGEQVAILVDAEPQGSTDASNTTGGLQANQQESGSKTFGDKENEFGSRGAGHPRTPPKRIHIVNVDVGRDYGAETEITGGLEGWEYVVVNPGDEVRENVLVIPQSASPQQPSRQQGQSDRDATGISSVNPEDNQQPSSSGSDSDRDGAQGKPGSRQGAGAHE